jgi:hypothetical protein
MNERFIKLVPLKGNVSSGSMVLGNYQAGHKTAVRGTGEERERWLNCGINAYIYHSNGDVIVT